MIEQFSRQMIERYLHDKNLVFHTNRDGNFFVNFEDDGDMPDYRMELRVLDEDVFCIVISPDVIYPETMRERIEAFVAGWNRQKLLPKAYTTEDERGRGIEVVGESSHHLAPGIRQDLLDHMIEVTQNAGFMMLDALACEVSASGS